MRTFFIAGAKLYGIYLICGALIGLSSIVLYGSLSTGPVDYTYYVTPATSFILGLLLIALATRLATWLNIPDSPTGIAMGEQATLRIGILLVGLFLLVGGLGTILELLINPLNPLQGWLGISGRFIRVFALLTPLYLIFGADRLARMLWRPSAPVEPKENGSSTGEFDSGPREEPTRPSSRRAYR